VNRRDRDLEAAAIIRRCRAELAARGGGIVREAVCRTAAAIEDWRHYPDGEAYDPLTHVQYFYHRHAAAAGRSPAPPDEGGHFHLFLRGEGIPPGVAPLLFADSAVGISPPPQSAPLRRGRREEVCHLAAIAVDACGEPTGLFATNRWVTGETWYRAEDVIRLIDRVRFDPARPPTLLDRWIAALVQLFAADIAELLRRRDKTMLEWRWRWPRRNVFEDTRLEIVSHLTVDLDARLAEIEAGAAAPTAMPAASHPAALAASADGWGR
jgi:hypothetical protein